MEPFLLRFKKACVSPRRSIVESHYIYDSSIDMVVVLKNNSMHPVIDMKEVDGLVTKKADVEKGDDQKDTLLWV